MECGVERATSVGGGAGGGGGGGAEVGMLNVGSGVETGGGTQQTTGLPPPPYAPPDVDQAQFEADKRAVYK